MDVDIGSTIDMPKNTYADINAADYLEEARIALAKLKAEKISNKVLTPSFIIPINETMNISDALATPVSGTPGSYLIVDDKADQPLFALFDQDVLDGSDNAHTLTITGTETYSQGPEPSPDKLRYAFSFDGSTFLTVSNESDFDFEHTNPFSVSFWINGASQANKIVVGKGSLGTAGWLFFTNNTTMVFRLTDSLLNTFQVITTAVTQNDGWHHIVVTFSGNSNRSGLKIYVDGVLDKTGTASAISNSILNNVGVTIGSGNGLSIFTGSLADVQIWKLVLSATNAADLSIGKQITNDVTPAFLGLSDVSA